MSETRMKLEEGVAPEYANDTVPAIFFDDFSAVSSNRRVAKFYLLRDDASTSDENASQRKTVVAQLIMDLGTFAQLAFQLKSTVLSMLDDNVFTTEEADLISNY